MALGSVITPEVKEIIVKVWQEHLANGWTAKEIKAEVARRVQKRWPGKYQNDWPGLRAVQSKLAEIKDEYKNYEPLLKPWQLGSLKDNPIPAEAVVYVLSVQNWVEEIKQSKGISLPFRDKKAKDFWFSVNQKSLDVTILQAGWIARLYGIYDWGRISNNIKQYLLVLYRLWTFSRIYLLDEVFESVAGKDLNTSDIDKALREHWNCCVYGYNFFLDPRENRTPGIMGGSLVDYSFDDTLEVVMKKEKDGDTK